MNDLPEETRSMNREAGILIQKKVHKNKTMHSQEVGQQSGRVVQYHPMCGIIGYYKYYKTVQEDVYKCCSLLLKKGEEAFMILNSDHIQILGPKYIIEGKKGIGCDGEVGWK